MDCQSDHDDATRGYSEVIGSTRNIDARNWELHKLRAIMNRRGRHKDNPHEDGLDCDGEKPDDLFGLGMRWDFVEDLPNFGSVGVRTETGRVLRFSSKRLGQLEIDESTGLEQEYVAA